MTTVLDKALRRRISVAGIDYTVAIDPDGLRLVGKGKRRPEVELRWSDLLSGEAAMAVALNASLALEKRPKASMDGKVPSRSGKGAARKRGARVLLEPTELG